MDVITFGPDELQRRAGGDRGAAARPPTPRAGPALDPQGGAYLKGRDPAADYVGSGSADGPTPPASWTLLDIPVDRGYAAAVAVHGELMTSLPRVNRLMERDIRGERNPGTG